MRTRLEPPTQCPVKVIFDFIQCPLAGQQFFIICELIFLCSYSFFFEFFFAYAVTVSNFSELFIYAATVFFLPELILHKYSVEGYFRITGAKDSVENYADFLLLVFEMMIFRNSIRNGMEIC